MTGESVAGRGSKRRVGEDEACAAGGERREGAQEAEQRGRGGEAPPTTTASFPCRAKCSPSSLTEHLHRPFSF